MTERFFGDIDPALIQELALTERALEDYSNEVLQDSIVDVSIIDCDHPFIRLPAEMAGALAEIANPPTAIKAVDLKLKYDKQDLRFTTLFAGLRLDNNYSMLFHRVQSRLPNTDGNFYYVALLDPVGAVYKRTDATQLMPEAEVARLLKTVGVGLPDSEQSADWNEIKAILQFTGLWTATTSHSTPLDLAHTLRITNRLEGSGRYGNLNGETDDDIRLHELTLAIDEAQDITVPPHISWEIKAISNSSHDKPCIKSLRSVPLEYRLPEFEDFGVAILGEMPYVRHEMTDQATTLPMNAELLRVGREAIESALKPKS